MSIFVVTTQAFSVTNQPVVVDWQYDTWGDTVITVTDSTITANTADDYDIQVTLSNSGGSSEQRTVRIELLYTGGLRVERTGQTNSDPDDDTKWLVAEQIVTVPASGSISTSVHSFVDEKVSDVVTGGGYFMIYTDEQSGIWTSGEYISEEKIHADIPAPAFGTTQIIRATGYSAVSGWVQVDTGPDDDTSEWVDQTSLDVKDDISFTWTETTGTAPINQVDISIKLEVVGFVGAKPDSLTIKVYVDSVLVTTPPSVTYAANIGAENSPITITIENVQRPGSAWIVDDIPLILVELDGVKVANVDLLSISYSVYDIFVTVNP